MGGLHLSLHTEKYGIWVKLNSLPVGHTTPEASLDFNYLTFTLNIFISLPVLLNNRVKIRKGFTCLNLLSINPNYIYISAFSITEYGLHNSSYKSISFKFASIKEIHSKKHTTYGPILHMTSKLINYQYKNIKTKMLILDVSL